MIHSFLRPLYVIRLLAAGCLLTVFMVGCQNKKVDTDPSKGLSAKIQRIVPTAVLDDMRAKGLVINEGSQPPQLAGIFWPIPIRSSVRMAPKTAGKKAGSSATTNSGSMTRPTTR